MSKPAYAQKPIVTGIGTLTFSDIKKAVAHAQSYDIPYVPELVKHDELFEGYLKRADKPETAGKLVCADLFKKTSYRIAKVQCVGHVSATAHPYNYKDAFKRITNHLLGLLDGLEAEETIVFLDEPGVGYSGVEFKEEWGAIFDAIESIYGPITRGAHICNDTDWDRVFLAGLDIVSFNAHECGDILIRFPEYEGYRKNGGRIAWGIVYASDIKDFRESDLITPTCGLRSSTTNQCHRKLEQLLRISNQFR